jgi:hypothetical protein
MLKIYLEASGKGMRNVLLKPGVTILGRGLSHSLKLSIYLSSQSTGALTGINDKRCSRQQARIAFARSDNSNILADAPNVSALPSLSLLATGVNPILIQKRGQAGVVVAAKDTAVWTWSLSFIHLLVFFSFLMLV